VDAEGRPRIGLCTTCGNRLLHLKRTLPSNLLDNAYPDLKHIVLDYSSDDGLEAWIMHAHAKDIEAGRLVFYRYPGAPYFRMSHAKNLVHRLAIREGCDILVNLDADNFTGWQFADYIAEKFAAATHEGEAIFLRARENDRGPPGGDVNNRQPQGAAGRIVLTANAFLEAGGYDESYVHFYGPDDKDLAARLTNIGYVRHGIHTRYLKAIWHENDLRFATKVARAPQSWSDADVLFRPVPEREHLGVVNNGRIGLGWVYRNGGRTPIQLRRLPTRIFGLGFQRTATTSLTRALKMLGFDAAHWESAKWARNIMGEMASEGRSIAVEGYYALADFPIPIMFRELDKAYPGSKFILTKRDEAGWLRSVEAHFARYKEGWDKPGDAFSNEMHRRVYGRTDFDAEVFLERYRRHTAEVLAYFTYRPEDLLVMDMSKNAGWGELCAFLDRPMPEAPYPLEFASPERPQPQPRPTY
jgi:hypothetical protein